MLWRTSNVRLRRYATSNLKLMSEDSNFILVFLLHFELILLELIDFVANQLHLLNLLCDLAFHLLGTSTLVVEFGAKGVEDLSQAMIGLTWGRRTQIRVTPMLRCVEHSGLYKRGMRK